VASLRGPGEPILLAVGPPSRSLGAIENPYVAFIAHPARLDAMRFGVLQARRGGLTKADVVNTRTWPQVQKLLGKKGG
jgi:hypothetical protein